MKIVRVLQIFLMFLLVGVMFTAASVDSSYECEDKNCIEGTEINFNVTVLNNINKSIIVRDVYIKDKDYNTVLAYDTEEEIVLKPNEDHEFLLTSTVKSPKQGYTFYYVPCFSVSHEENPDDSSEICGKAVKSLTVIPLDKIECTTNDECAEDEYCNTFSLYKCVKLECEQGQTIVNHKCVDVLPKQITVINWWNVFILSLTVIVAALLIFLLLGKEKEEKNDEGDFDIDLSEEENRGVEEKLKKQENEKIEKKPKHEEVKDKRKEHKKQEEENHKEDKENLEETKKKEKKNKTEKEFKKENNEGKGIENPGEGEKPEKKMKKKKTKKKYKKVDKEIKPIIDEGYNPMTERDKEVKKQNPSEMPYDEETNDGVVDYGGDDDEDDEENRNPFM